MMAGMPGTALFVYGSLLDEARLEALTGRRFPRRPARLEGYERIAPPGDYPYIVARPGAAVDGVLIEDVDDDSLRGLDRYEDEGRLYARQPVEVVAGDVRIACETYVGAGTRSRGDAAPVRTPRRTSSG